MASSSHSYATKELSEKTWPDFVKLFSPKSGWNHCWCVHFHRPHPLPKKNGYPPARKEPNGIAANKKPLLDRGCSHGILVYLDREPVGWCQYGPREELARIDRFASYKKVRPANSNTKNKEPKKLWRITCFVVNKKHRRQGIAGVALRAALQSIKKQGGGIVEAYPVQDWSGGSFGNLSTHGTVSMFKKQRFKIIAPFNNTNVIMRRTM
jgi:hypothetical protein